MRKIRPDHVGREHGMFKHNKELIRKTCEVCALCGRPINKDLKYPDPYSFTVDHIIPISRGGGSTMDNLQAAHLVCNKNKGTKLYRGKIVEPEVRLPQYIDWTAV